jgi:hypothetical protein
MRLAAAMVKRGRDRAGTSQACEGFAMSMPMPSERAFRVLREQSDRVSLRQIASIALACVGIGLGLSSSVERCMHANARAGEREQHTHAGPAQATAAGGRALVASAALALPFGVAHPLGQPQTPIQRAAPADRRGGIGEQGNPGRLRFARERVTYLRCQHARDGAACTRKPALENQVWRALRSLGTCYDETLPGHAELQLGIRADHAPGIAFFAPAAGSSLNLRAVRGCVERPLSKFLERLSDEPVFVSFRFGLR